MEVGTDASGRPVGLRDIEWDHLFSPSRIAFIGATDTVGSQQRAQFLFLKERMDPRGIEVIPIHPTKKDVLGVAAFPSVLDVSGDIDVAIILVREPLGALEECVAKGVPFVIIFSAGFSELGTDEGRAAEARVVALANGATRVIGPNTNLNVFEPWRQDLPGRKLAIVTQSGFQGRPMSQGQTYGIPIQSWATLGNEADVEWADFVRHYAALPDTGAIVTYIEGFKDGRTMMLAADAAARAGVPIVAIKVGRSERGQAMAQAHTGHLTGSDAVHEAVFAQVGVTRVDDIDEAIEISGMFCHVPVPGGNDGVAIFALSGGTAAHLVDLCGAADVPTPKLEDRTIKALAEHIPSFLRIDNPVDTGGTIVMTPAGRAVLDLLMDDENTNVLMVPITGVFPGMIEPLVKDLVELHEQQRKPILVIWASPERDIAAYRTLCDRGVPLFHSLGSAVRGAQALLQHRHTVEHYESPFGSLPLTPTPEAAAARRRLATGAPLNEVEAKALLASFGIPVVAETVVTSSDEARQAVQSIGSAAVMKILAPGIAHKSDFGLVRVGVTAEEAAEVYRQLRAEAARVAPDEAVDGVVVQPLVGDVVAEAIIGVSHQEPFGPVVMFGLGGVFVEVFGDVAFGVPPFTRRQAEALVARTRGARLLAGTRGRPPGDVTALVDAIMAVQRLAIEVGDSVAEIDINPVMVLPNGRGVVAVDALVVPRANGDTIARVAAVS